MKKGFKIKMIKWLLPVLACVFLLIPMTQPAHAATFEDINETEVFIKQQTSGTCTLCANVMLLRRQALINGDEDWSSITESGLKARSSIWSSAGMSHSYTYNGMTVVYGTLKTDYDEKVEQLQTLLTAHPEGIVLYDRTVPHAVLLTDYTNGEFYCADPSQGVASGRIRLADAYKVTISKATCYWYETSTSKLDPSPVQSVVSTEDSVITFETDEEGNIFYLVNGEADAAFNGFAQYEENWWLFESGQADQEATGFYYTTVNGETAWWYVKNGMVQKTATSIYKGMVDEESGWWYVKNGKVALTTTSVEKRVENGTWWYVKNGKVSFSTTSVEKRVENGTWWYIKGGKVAFGTNSVVKRVETNTWWYVKNAKVIFSYTGIAKNSKGTWYVVNGKVNFSYTGPVTMDDVTYTVVKGKASL